MKKYTRPNAEIAKFTIENIITASGEVVNASTLSGADADMYAIYKESSRVKSENISVFTW